MEPATNAADPADRRTPIGEAHQHVSAVAGFAYGAVGADIHVFGDGTPLYLLETYQPTQPPETRWLREMPSRMLDARSRVVPFTGRHTEREDLHAWLNADARLAVRWLHGLGGQGKTRLVRQRHFDLRAAWRRPTRDHRLLWTVLMISCRPLPTA